MTEEKQRSQLRIDTDLYYELLKIKVDLRIKTIDGVIAKLVEVYNQK